MKFDKDITKIKRVTFFLRHSVVSDFIPFTTSRRPSVDQVCDKMVLMEFWKKRVTL